MTTLPDHRTQRVLNAYTEKLARSLGVEADVFSGASAWLLLAFLASAAKGRDLEDMEEALGMPAEYAGEVARALLAAPPSAVRSALAVWGENLTDAFKIWKAALPAGVTAGPVPSQADADLWASENTSGMIKRFPVDLSPTAEFVLASALACESNWKAPLRVVPAAALSGPFSGMIRECMVAPKSDRTLILDTASAGLVGAHSKLTSDGLTVLSVIAGQDVSRSDTVEAVEEIVAFLTGRPSSVREVSLAELPAEGDFPWEVEEVRSPSPADSFTVYLPAWVASSQSVDLSAAPGFPAAARTALSFVSDPVGVQSRQSAVAQFGPEGFSAAAVSAVSVFAGNAFSPREFPALEATLRFGHPYAVTAFVSEPGPWDGVQVFSAWVSKPANPDSLD